MKSSLPFFLLICLCIIANYTAQAQVQFSYMGQYNSMGVPDNLEDSSDAIGQLFLNDINTALPDMKPVPDFHPEYIAQNNETDVVLKAHADLWITFVSEGGDYTNALGYYTYNASNPPKSPSDIKTKWIIFPNVSLVGSGGGLKSGNKIYLGSFEAGTALGWFVVADAFKNGKVTQGKYIVYSEPALNPEKDPKLKAHTVLLKDAQRGKLVLSFEDLLRDQGSDQDFNDLTFYITANPYSAINTDAVVSIDGSSTPTTPITTTVPVTTPTTTTPATTTTNVPPATSGSTSSNTTNNTTSNTTNNNPNININNNVNNNANSGGSNVTTTNNNVNTGTSTNSNNNTTNNNTNTNSNNTTTIVNNTTVINKTGGGHNGGYNNNTNNNNNNNTNTNVNNNTNHNGNNGGYNNNGNRNNNNNGSNGYNNSASGGYKNNNNSVNSSVTVCNQNGFPVSNFNTLLSTIKAQTVESNKPMVIKQAVQNKRVTVSQVKEIIKLIVVEQYKLDMAEYLFDYTCDKSNYYELNALLLPSRARELDAYLQGKDRTDDNVTSINTSINNSNNGTSQNSTYVENNSYSSTSGSGGSLCDNGRMPANELDDLKSSINSKPFSDSKMSILKEAMPSRCINTTQVKDIMTLFTFESDKLTVAKYLYRYTSDKANYYKVNDAFSFSSSIDELKAYIKNGK